MKTITIKTLIVLLAICLFSCSKDTSVEEEIAIIESVKIPVDKQLEIEILEEINKHRISIGLSTLKKLNTIKSQTCNHAKYMIEQNKISHEHFAERSAYLNNQVGAKKVGENVARGYTNAKKLVEAWLASESHKNTMEDNYTHFDITAEQNEYGIWFYANLFVRK